MRAFVSFAIPYLFSVAIAAMAVLAADILERSLSVGYIASGGGVPVQLLLLGLIAGTIAVLALLPTILLAKYIEREGLPSSPLAYGVHGAGLGLALTSIALLLFDPLGRLAYLAVFGAAGFCAGITFGSLRLRMMKTASGST